MESDPHDNNKLTFNDTLYIMKWYTERFSL